MSDNQIKEQQLGKVVGGAGESGENSGQTKYEVGYSYDSGLLSSGMPNHHITITVKKQLGFKNGEMYYELEYFEEAYGCRPQRLTIEKPESYLDGRKHDK